MQLLTSNQVVMCDEQTLKRMPIQKAIDLGHEEWVMMYQHNARRSNYEVADKIYNTFRQASNQLKIRVGEPHFIELDDERDIVEAKAKLMDYMMAGPQAVFRHPKIVVVVLGMEKNYP